MNPAAMTIINIRQEYWLSRVSNRTSNPLFSSPARYRLSYQLNLFNPLPDYKILDWSKLKRIADEILECIKNEK